MRPARPGFPEKNQKLIMQEYKYELEVHPSYWQPADDYTASTPGTTLIQGIQDAEPASHPGDIWSWSALEETTLFMVTQDLFL